jgi:hypothetical protein
MYKLICIAKTPNNAKKFQVTLYDTETGKTKSIRFGSTGRGDYTIFNKTEGKESADEHKRLYILRHQKREDWTKSGVLTAGFWAKNILWNKRSLEDSINDTIKKFDLN